MITTRPSVPGLCFVLLIPASPPVWAQEIIPVPQPSRGMCTVEHGLRMDPTRFFLDGNRDTRAEAEALAQPVERDANIRPIAGMKERDIVIIRFRGEDNPNFLASAKRAYEDAQKVRSLLEEARWARKFIDDPGDAPGTRLQSAMEPDQGINDDSKQIGFADDRNARLRRNGSPFIDIYIPIWLPGRDFLRIDDCPYHEIAGSPCRIGGGSPEEPTDMRIESRRTRWAMAIAVIALGGCEPAEERGEPRAKSVYGAAQEPAQARARLGTNYPSTGPVRIDPDGPASKSKIFGIGDLPSNPDGPARRPKSLGIGSGDGPAHR